LANFGLERCKLVKILLLDLLYFGENRRVAVSKIGHMEIGFVGR
jgi:hypothetical protein